MLWLVWFEVKRAIGTSFEHEDVSMRLRREEEAIDLNAAKVLFGGSNEDLTTLADTQNEARGGDLTHRRPSTPYKAAAL